MNENPGADAPAYGRIDADGTVYVRTADGERAVGSWHAGTPEEGLAFYRRKYDDLATEVSILEHRLAGGEGDPAAIRSAATKLQEALPTANAVGDLADLERRLIRVLSGAAEKLVVTATQRAHEQEEAAAARRALVEEAEKLATSTQWKVSGDRLREIGEEWKALPRGDRKTEDELWRRLKAAREEFSRRRGAHFATLDEQRKSAQARKEQLATEAEGLVGSSEWGPTAARFKAMMGEWKAAGPAPRSVEDELWQRFRGAQDAFFVRRSEVFSERDAEQQRNLEVKEALVAEAEAVDPAADLEEAKRRLRDIQERYDAVGHVPRDAVAKLERRMEAAQDKVREVADAQWRRTNPQSSPLVTRLQESIGKLENKLRKAREAGRDAEAAEVEQALATQREWLAQAESS